MVARMQAAANRPEEILNPSDEQIRAMLAAENRQWREAPGAFIRALLEGDPVKLWESMMQLDRAFEGWRRAFRRCAKLESIPADMKIEMLEAWYQSGDHLRCEVGDDLVLIKALWVLLPPYDGPGLTLYRGDSARNRSRRTYGLSWSTNPETAAGFAEGSWRWARGGSVLLRATVPAEAIICAPALIANHLREDEYIVDRRYLRRVFALRRYAQVPWHSKPAVEN